MQVALVRISTQEQVRGKTIDSQIAHIKDFAKNKIDKIYSDLGWSGSILARPALDELRSDIREGKVTKLYIYHPDRLSRKQSHQFLLLDEFQKAGVEVVFTSVPDFFTGSEESLVINKSVFSMVSELERLRIRDRLRRGKDYRVKQGVIVGSQAPYGFTYLKGEGKFIHNPEEIGTAKLILNWALEGRGQREIVKLLKEKNIPTRTGNPIWQKSSVSKILSKNLDCYSGIWYFNKVRCIEGKTKTKYSQREKTSARYNPKEAWIAVPLPKELAVITKGEAEKIRANQKKNRVVLKGKMKNDYLLRGHLFCANCLGLNYSDFTHQVRSYRCADRKRNFLKDGSCSGGSIKADHLEKAVWGKLVKLLTSKQTLRREVRKYIKRTKDDRTPGKDMALLIKKQFQLNSEKERLIQAYAKGFISEEELVVQKARLLKEEGNLQLAVYDERDKQYKAIDPQMAFTNLNNLATEAKKFLTGMDFETKRKVLDLLDVKIFYFQRRYKINCKVPLVDEQYISSFYAGATRVR